MKQEEQKLIALAQKKDEEAIEILIKRYRNMIFIVMRDYGLYLKGMEVDDFIQEGTLGILKAIKYFDNTKNMKFSNFVRLCIKSVLISFVKKYSSQKYTILTQAIYSYKPVERVNQEELSFEEVYSSDRDNPERILLLKELFKELKIFFREELSLFEQQILILLRNGYSYKEICITLERESKKIDNAIQRVRQKLKKQYFL